MIFVKDTEAVMRNGFKFTAYMGPPPADARDGKKIAKTENLMTKENYANIKACGFDGVTGLYEHIPFQYKTALDFDRVFALSLDKAEKAEEKVDAPAEIVALAEKMQAARAQKNYAEADALRAEIDAAGYMVANTKDGYTLKPKK